MYIQHDACDVGRFISVLKMYVCVWCGLCVCVRVGWLCVCVCVVRVLWCGVRVCGVGWCVWGGVCLCVSHSWSGTFVDLMDATVRNHTNKQTRTNSSLQLSGFRGCRGRRSE